MKTETLVSESRFYQQPSAGVYWCCVREDRKKAHQLFIKNMSKNENAVMWIVGMCKLGGSRQTAGSKCWGEEEGMERSSAAAPTVNKYNK